MFDESPIPENPVAKAALDAILEAARELNNPLSEVTGGEVEIDQISHHSDGSESEAMNALASPLEPYRRAETTAQTEADSRFEDYYHRLPESLRERTDWRAIFDKVESRRGGESESMRSENHREGNGVDQRNPDGSDSAFEDYYRQLPDDLKPMTDWRKLYNAVPPTPNERSTNPERSPEQHRTFEQAISYRVPGTGHEIAPPTREELIHAPFEQLEHTFEQTREAVSNYIDGNRESLPYLGFHGRIQSMVDDMVENKELKDRDGRTTSYIATARELGESGQEILSDLLRVACFTESYTNPTELRRQGIDYIPGAVVVVDLTSKTIPQAGIMPGVTLLGKNTNNYIGESSRAGEKTIGIHPDNYDELVRGIIPWERVERFADVLADIAADDFFRYSRSDLAKAWLGMTLVAEALFGSPTNEREHSQE